MNQELAGTQGPNVMRGRSGEVENQETRAAEAHDSTKDREGEQGRIEEDKLVSGGKKDGDGIFSWDEGAKAEPWAEPVNGAELLEELAGLVRRYVVMGSHGPETIALWVVHTYGFQLRDVTTYIGIESPQKRCGKTTLLTVLNELVKRPVVASNISSPAFFRVIEEKQPTLMIDEADTVLHRNDELRGILNAGYRRKTAYVVRVARGEW
jgi:putative DNA primase/helicase